MALRSCLQYEIQVGKDLVGWLKCILFIQLKSSPLLYVGIVSNLFNLGRWNWGESMPLHSHGKARTGITYFSQGAQKANLRKMAWWPCAWILSKVGWQVEQVKTLERSGFSLVGTPLCSCNSLLASSCKPKYFYHMYQLSVMTQWNHSSSFLALRQNTPRIELCLINSLQHSTYSYHLKDMANFHLQQCVLNSKLPKIEKKNSQCRQCSVGPLSRWLD